MAGTGESASDQLVKLCSEVAADGEGHMAGAQPARGDGLAPTRHAPAKMPNPRRCRICRTAEGKGQVRPDSGLHQLGTTCTKRHRDRNERARR